MSDEQVLRTHTSAHQSALMREGKEAFLCTGDVYRRDEIDASHFPAFHQASTARLRETRESLTRLLSFLACARCSGAAGRLR